MQLIYRSFAELALDEAELEVDVDVELNCPPGQRQAPTIDEMLDELFADELDINFQTKRTPSALDLTE